MQVLFLISFRERFGDLFPGGPRSLSSQNPRHTHDSATFASLSGLFPRGYPCCWREVLLLHGLFASPLELFPGTVHPLAVPFPRLFPAQNNVLGGTLLGQFTTCLEMFFSPGLVLRSAPVFGGVSFFPLPKASR